MGYHSSVVEWTHHGTLVPSVVLPSTRTVPTVLMFLLLWFRLEPGPERRAYAAPLSLHVLANN